MLLKSSHRHTRSNLLSRWQALALLLVMVIILPLFSLQISATTIDDEIVDGGIYLIKSVNSGKYLTVSGAGEGDGTNIIQNSLYGNNNNQMWVLKKYQNDVYMLMDMNSLKYLSVYGSLASTCANIWLWHNDGTDGQKFKIRKNTDGTYSFLTKSSSYTKVIDVEMNPNSGMTDGNNVQQYTDNLTANQKFTLELCSTIGVQSSQMYYLRNVSTGRFLDVVNGIDADGTNVWTYPRNNANAQKWTIIEQSSTHKYRLQTAVGSGTRYLTVSGSNLQINTARLTSSQDFFLSRVRETDYHQGAYYIKMDGKYVSCNTTNYNVELSSTLNEASMWSLIPVTLGNAYCYCNEYWNWDLTNWPHYDTTNSADDFTQISQAMGYSSLSFLNSTNKSLILSYMESSTLYGHFGHGNRNGISLTSDATIFYDIKSDAIRGKAYNNFSKLQCFLAMSCSTGYCDPTGTTSNFIQSIYMRGAHFAIGFQDNTMTPGVHSWISAFMENAEQGETIENCVYAGNNAANSTLFALGSYYCVGDMSLVLN